MWYVWNDINIILYHTIPFGVLEKDPWRSSSLEKGLRGMNLRDYI
jgi:hypothetical protein